MKSQRKMVMPLVLVFVIINALLMLFKGRLQKADIDQEVLIVANLLFFVISLLVFFMQRKALSNPNPHVFIRSVMSGMMIKMFVCIIAVVAYAMLSGSSYNKAAVFGSLMLYLIYLAVEVGTIMKLNKKPNA